MFDRFALGLAGPGLLRRRRMRRRRREKEKGVESVS